MGGTVVTELEKVEIWDRRARGESLSTIARRLDRGLETIRRCLLLTGGVRPRPRTRSRRELTVAEREEISRALAAQRACRAIAMRSRQAPSSVARDVGRKGGRVGYPARAAVQASRRRHERAEAL